MNLFILDYDHAYNALCHVDRHIVKMPVETAQQLSTALHIHGISGPYKPAYTKHPCTQWVASSQQAYWWAVCYGRALCQEYTYRYGRIHKCEAIINQCALHIDQLPDMDMPPHAQAMPDQYKHQDAVHAYRSYYCGAKQHLARWTNRPQPNWFVQS